MSSVAVSQFGGTLRNIVANRDSENHSSKLINLVSDAVIAIDASGRIVLWNTTAEALYGWASREAIGRNARELLNTCCPGNPGGATPGLLMDREWRGELHRRTRGGAELLVESRWVPWYDDSGVRAGTVCVERDVTQQKKMEAALWQHQKLTVAGRLVATTAHEINNPLACVTNLLYLLRQHPTLDDTARNYVDMAETELQRASAITRQMLSFHKESAEPVAVDITEILDCAASLYNTQERRPRIEIEKLYDCAPTVHGYPGQLRQVFVNLISNAVDAGARHLQIHVSNWRLQMAPYTAGCRIVIGDDGSGISEERLSKIFEPFYTTKGERGTGLGLWVVLGIVHKHGGQVRVRSSRKPGRTGTCFSVFLPATFEAIGRHRPRTRRYQQLRLDV